MTTKGKGGSVYTCHCGKCYDHKGECADENPPTKDADKDEGSCYSDDEIRLGDYYGNYGTK